MAQFQLGSISTGTLRTEDLLSAFVSALESLSPMGTNHPYMGDAYQILEQGTDDESETTELLSDIEHELNNLCPPFVYFGAHPGDGADYGFWPDMDSLNQELPYGDVTFHADERILDAYDVIVQVSDHGNLTVMDMDRNVLWTTT
jgi:hypothetical protein